MNDAAKLVPHSEVQSQPRTNAPIVLKEKGVHHPPDMRFGIAIKQGCGFQSASGGAYGDCAYAVRPDNNSRCRTISQRARYIVLDGILTGQESEQPVASSFRVGALSKAEIAFSVGPCASVLMVGHDHTTEPHGVVAQQVADLIVDFDGSVRPLDLRVTRPESAEAVES